MNSKEEDIPAGCRSSHTLDDELQDELRVELQDEG